VNWQKFTSWTIPLQRGNSPPAVIEGDVKGLPFPVPPHAEQRRIVARIDELFAEIAEGEAALERARSGLDTWRRALLKAAVTGELTREWREEKCQTESGAELLVRLQGHHETATLRRTRRRGWDAPDALDTSALPQLPKEWTWARLSELGEFGRGKSKHRPRDDPRLYGGTTPFVQTGAVANADDYIRDFSQTYSNFGVEQSRVWPKGTLCIAIAANIADTAILSFDACFPDSVVGLIPADGVDAYFVHMWMQTIQSRLEAYAPATAQKNINLEILNQVAVPLPPTTEQQEIISRFHSAMDFLREYEIQLGSNADRVALCQSILKSAFEGRLVPQDPADEPASVLLARLRAEASSPPPRRPRGRKSAS
jgi:type I restriction enzyme S subunit